VSAPRAPVLVVGAGVFGAGAAWELRRRGHAVLLLDPGPIPHPDASSTDVSKIVRTDYGSDAFYHELAGEAMAGWDRWNAECPRPLYHEDGFLLLSASSLDAGGFEHESLRMQERAGNPVERLSGEALSARFPRWSADAFAEGYLNRRAGWAESGAVVEWMVDRALDAGVVLEETGVESLAFAGDEVTGVVTTDGRTVRGSTVVVAAGSWTPALVPWLGGLMSVTGQPVLHFLVEDPTPFQAPVFPTWAADIANTGWYGFPALDDGRVKVGHHGPGIPLDARPGDAAWTAHEERCRAFLQRAVPALADAPVVTRRVCRYCDSRDGDFLVDRDPGHPGLVVASGGSGHGFKFAPVLGRIIADVVDGSGQETYSRFRWRTSAAARPEQARSRG